jgi:hypothetical protein
MIQRFARAARLMNVADTMCFAVIRVIPAAYELYIQILVTGNVQLGSCSGGKKGALMLYSPITNGVCYSSN